MNDLVEVLVRYGYLVVFGWVFAEQIGLPIPAMPVLLAAGAMAGTGRLSLVLVLVLAGIASLVSDVIWYWIGRLGGGRVLGFLCRISLEPDSCVRRTEETFSRRGARSLLIAKFVPGYSTAAPPLAGIVRMRFARFGLHRHRRPHLGRRLCRSRLAVQPPAGTSGELRHAPGRRARRASGGGFRRLYRVEVYRAATVSAADPDRANHAGRAEGYARWRGGRDGCGRSPPGGVRERADDHPARAPSDDRGPGSAPAGGPARPGHRPLLHLTQRGLQRPGGADPETPRHRTGPSAGRRLPSLARSRLSDDQRGRHTGRGPARSIKSWTTRSSSWSTMSWPGAGYASHSSEPGAGGGSENPVSAVQFRPSPPFFPNKCPAGREVYAQIRHTDFP